MTNVQNLNKKIHNFDFFDLGELTSLIIDY